MRDVCPYHSRTPTPAAAVVPWRACTACLYCCYLPLTCLLNRLLLLLLPLPQACLESLQQCRGMLADAQMSSLAAMLKERAGAGAGASSISGNATNAPSNAAKEVRGVGCR